MHMFFGANICWNMSLLKVFFVHFSEAVDREAWCNGLTVWVWNRKPQISPCLLQIRPHKWLEAGPCTTYLAKGRLQRSPVYRRYFTRQTNPATQTSAINLHCPVAVLISLPDTNSTTKVSAICPAQNVWCCSSFCRLRHTAPPLWWAADYLFCVTSSTKSGCIHINNGSTKMAILS